MMTVDMYKDQHKALMEKWKEKRNAKINGFAEDGIVSPEKWFALPAKEERIMILLKEAYAKEDAKSEKKLVWSEAKWLAHEICMEDCGKDCEKCKITGSTFNPVAEWIYGIVNATDGELKAYDNWLGVTSRKNKEYCAARDSWLARAAIVNVKKSGGVSKSAYEDIKHYAEQDREYLIEQIELIKPTVIVCGGTYEMLCCIYPELNALPHTGNGATMLGNIKVIASCHPNHHIKNEHKYNNVVGNYIDLLRQGKPAEQ